MDAVHTYAAGDEVASADLNNIQAQAASLYQVAWGWRGRRPTLTCDGSNIIIGAHEGVCVGTSQATGRLLADAAAETMALSGLSAGWYYVYAYYDSPATIYEWSTTAPDASLSYKTGDKTKAYVGCFYALTATTAHPFRMVGGRYVYAQSHAAGTPFTLGAYTSAGSPHTLSFTTFLPPHARLVRLRVLTNASGAATVALQTFGASGGTYDYADIAPIAGTQLVESLEMETNSSRQIGLGIANAGVTIQVQAFSE